jgi:ribosomal-protein-alanine N-acetyltransferase
LIRAVLETDLPAIAEIQSACPDAAQWAAGTEPILVAVVEGRVAGFVVWRRLDDAETEILNLAVHPRHRRKGLAKALVLALRELSPGDTLLEVRERNQPAIELYKSVGFQILTKRKDYYGDPPDTAVVMVWRSC